MTLARRSATLVAWTAMAALAGGLHLWNGARDAARESARAASLELGPLVAPGATRWIASDGTRAPVAALSITDGRGPTRTYARAEGLWRCLDHFAAIASEGRILGLLETLLETRAVTLSEAGELDLAAYGLDAASARRVALHGPDLVKDPDRDVLFAVDLGRSLPGGGGCFARVADTNRVLELDRDLVALLADPPRPGGLSALMPGAAGPPLLERLAIPSAWEGNRTGIRRVFVDRADGSGFELRLDEQLAPTAEGTPPPPAYVVVPAEGGPGVPSHPALATGYTLFLTRAPMDEVLDPQAVPASVLEDPDVIVTVQPMEGDVVELRIATDLAGTRATLVDLWGQAAYRFDPDLLPLLAPEPTDLTDATRGILWDAYLR